MNGDPSVSLEERALGAFEQTQCSRITKEISDPEQLSTPLERWSRAATRLGLDAAATAGGAALLRAELSEPGASAEAGRPPRRSELIAEITPLFGRQTALASVVALEAAGVASSARYETGAWQMQQLELTRQVREYCTGALVPSGTPHDDLLAIPRVARTLVDVARRCEGEPTRYLIALGGRPGSGRDTVLAYLLARLNVTARERSVYELRGDSDRLEPELSGAATIWDARRSDPGPDDYSIARRWLSRSKTVAVALVDTHQDIPDVPGRVVLRLDLDPKSQEERSWIWSSVLARVDAEAATRAAATRRLAERNRAGIGLAMRALALRGDAASPDADSLVREFELALAAQAQPSSMRGIVAEAPLRGLSSVISTGYVPQGLQQLRLLCQWHSHLATSGRSGVSALFTGPSGTGKTMAARALAAELGRPLFRVDLSAVVSKWVGETEKNLREAMAAAEAVGAVLLFDEGDALFGKRGEIAKGSDRYANVEVAYLLQAIEAFDGIAVATTNLRSNIDEAFERRFDITIAFEAPDAPARVAIWRQELAEAAATLPVQQLPWLGRAAELTGGAIASAARFARALAIDRGAAGVSEQDLGLAVRNEFLKMGATVQAAEWQRRSCAETTSDAGRRARRR